MLESLKKYTIILGSNSPRRKELLRGLGIDYRVVSNNTDENYSENLKEAEIPMYLAEKKAESYSLKANDLLITADTIVWLNGMVYGKPTDKEDAHRMLKELSGVTHQVITGVCIRTLEKKKVFHAVTNVCFAKLDEDEIEYYLNNYKPYDKAGSYGVQEWIGYVGVERIEGSYYNVMGLPIQRLYTELKNWD